MESEIKKMGKELSELKNQDLSNEKLNSFIELSLKQNEVLGLVYGMAKETIEGSVNSLGNITQAMEQYNENFGDIKKWMNDQLKHNDDVVDKFAELIISIDKIKER